VAIGARSFAFPLLAQTGRSEHAAIEPCVPVRKRRVLEFGNRIRTTQPQLLPIEYGQGIADIGGHVRIEPVRTHHDRQGPQQPIAVGTH
jgi:hypothetical protein